MLNLWWVNLDYLVLRSVVTSDPPISFLDISQLVHQQLHLHGIEAVHRAREPRGRRINSKHVDLHIVPIDGRTYIDFFHHVDDLYMNPVRQSERVVLLHALVSQIPGLHIGPLLAYRADLAYTFSCGRIARQSIRRVRSRRKLWPEPVPYMRGEMALYSKSQDLKSESNRLRSKRYILELCSDLGYDEHVHGELKRAEFRLRGSERLRELGWPDLERMGRRLLIEEYPLMLRGGKRGKRVDPDWTRLSMGVFPRPSHLPQGVWKHTGNRQAVINKALGLLEWAMAVILADRPVTSRSSAEVFRAILRANYPAGSQNERDLLSRISIEREGVAECSDQLCLPFDEDRDGLGASE